MEKTLSGGKLHADNFPVLAGVDALESVAIVEERGGEIAHSATLSLR